MMRSGDRSAYWALGIAGLQLLARPIDRILEGREKALLGTPGENPQPIILIVGAPRSGTTLVHQALTSVFQCSYFTNFDALFPRSTILAARAFKKLSRKRRDLGQYGSFYGKTAGLRGPNDAFHVWNRWLGGRHAFPDTPIGPETAEDMARFFAVWTAEFPLPLINKNNRNSLCVADLAKALPSAFFVVIERDPLYVAQSLYLARIQVHGTPGVGWGLMTKQADARHGVSNDAVGSVCAQVAETTGDLARDLARVPAERCIRVRYEDFCEAPGDQLAALADAVTRASGVELGFREGISLPERFPDANRQKLPDALFQEFEDRLRQLIPEALRPR